MLSSTLIYYTLPDSTALYLYKNTLNLFYDAQSVTRRVSCRLTVIYDYNFSLFNFGHLGCQNLLLTQECQGTTTTTTFRHQPMRSQLVSQPANEEPALFVNIFFLEICPYIFFENLSIYFFENLTLYFFFENLSKYFF